jgi:hypothetical protein
MEESFNPYGLYAFVYVSKMDDLVSHYNKLIQNCETLKYYSFNKYDLSRSGYNITNEALKTLFYGLKGLRDPETIESYEEPFISESFGGGMIFSNPCILDNAILLDLNSFYLSELMCDKFTFPLTKGELQIHSQFPFSYFEYGIYHCKIYKSNDDMINRLFYFKNSNYYTHYDLHVRFSC